MKKCVFPLLIAALFFNQAWLSAQNQPKKWSVEVNPLWIVYPGNLYSVKALYRLFEHEKSAGEIYLGLLHRPSEFREKEGDFSNSALLFGYRHYAWKGFNIEWYNAAGPGRLDNSVVDGKDYRSFDLEIGGLLGYTFEFNKRGKLPFYVDLQPVGLAYVYYRSNGHPVAGQDREKPIYFGAIQAGLRF
ncbi:MAG: hypothetical protein SFV22_18430 [Saprospiraceae bacterium]|nr:hypothetical protein [Saprospiraceae bacterium]